MGLWGYRVYAQQFLYETPNRSMASKCVKTKERQIFLNYCKTQLEVTKMSLLREEMYTCVQNFFTELTK